MPRKPFDALGLTTLLASVFMLMSCRTQMRAPVTVYIDTIGKQAQGTITVKNLADSDSLKTLKQWFFKTNRKNLRYTVISSKYGIVEEGVCEAIAQRKSLFERR